MSTQAGEAECGKDIFDVLGLLSAIFCVFACLFGRREASKQESNLNIFSLLPPSAAKGNIFKSQSSYRTLISKAGSVDMAFHFLEHLHADVSVGANLPSGVAQALKN